MVKRQELPKTAPQALSDRARTRPLRAAQRADARGKALAYIGYYVGVRGGEAIALDLDDVRITARKGVLIVRYGKGDKYRGGCRCTRTCAPLWRSGSPNTRPGPVLRRTRRCSSTGAPDSCPPTGPTTS